MARIDSEVAMRHLFSRQVDHTGNTFSGFDTIAACIRRENRASAPSPSSSAREGAAIATPSIRRTKGSGLMRQAAIARPSTATTQEPEMSDSETELEDEQESGSLEEEDDEASQDPETEEVSQDLEDDELHVGLAPQAWNVVQILDSRDDHLRGVTECLLRWARTTHATAELRISLRRGRLMVKVDGGLWKIVSHVDTGPNRRSGQPETIVEWSDTWHTMWELNASLMPAIRRFAMENPPDQKEVGADRQPDLRDWVLYLKDFKDPDPDPAPDTVIDENLIEDHVFEIEAGLDYSMSFLQHEKMILQNGGKLRSPVIYLMLNMPARQRDIFNQEFAEAHAFDGSSSDGWRSLAVSIAGLAHRTPCSYCANTPPDKRPYKECISWGNVFKGSCTNCAYTKGRVTTLCECRTGPFTWKNNARLIQEPEVQVDAGDDGSASSVGRREVSVGGQSSVGRRDQDDAVVTPPSERSTPAPDGKDDEQSASSGRRSPDDEGFSPPIDDTADLDMAGNTSRAVVNELPNVDMPTSPIAGPSTEQHQVLSSRQLSKRPVTLSDGSGFNLAKKARMELRAPEMTATQLEDAQTFKREPSSSARRAPDCDVSHHTSCSQKVRGRCIDPVVGCDLPELVISDPPPYIVYCHQNEWESGDLDEDQVKFIISRCPCRETQWLNDAWNGLVRANPENRHQSKSYCPVKPLRPGEVIELDD